MCSRKHCAAMTITALAICAVVGLYMFYGTSVRGDDDAGSAAPAAQYDNQNASSTDTQDKTISLQGKGRQASEKFALEPGLSIFEVAHDGESNLIIRLLDENGQVVDTLFNQIGPYQGRQGFTIAKGGRMLLDVAADGNWTVAVRQPHPTEGAPIPTTLQGTGSDATPFIQLEKGLAVFKMTHDGEARFRVTLTDENGRPIESLINTLGKFDGSKPLNIEKSGIYFLNISADGDWSIDVE